MLQLASYHLHGKCQIINIHIKDTYCAVNKKVYKGFHCHADDMQYLNSQLVLLIHLDNTYSIPRLKCDEI